jgi:methylated-DNA-[protein]-cysteine S-methyltransferase
MTTTDERQLISALSVLAVPAPPGLMDRVVAHWAYLEGPIVDVYVAFGPAGISSVVPAPTVGGDDEFIAAFRHQFGRPLLVADDPPDGVEDALRTGRAVDLRFDLSTRTQFEQDVLNAALEIPPGEIRPYSWIAHQIKRPRAVRAVGTALGHNPVPVLIPCHRVVRSDGDMGQYGFGRAMKRQLLDGEGVDVDLVGSMVRRGSNYVGDDTSSVVCMPTCHRLLVVESAHRHGFRSLAEAAADGYRPCQDCRPVGR